MESLGLIITGQLRTFFKETVQESFQSFLEGLCSKYDVYMLLVINETEIPYEKFVFLNKYVKRYTIVDYPRVYKDFELKNTIQEIMLSIEDDLEGVREERERENSAEWNLQCFYYQITQIQIGLQGLYNYDISFNTIMRTRFDVYYTTEIIPYSNPNCELVPHSIEHEYKRHVLFRRFKFSTVESFMDTLQYTHFETNLRVFGVVRMLGFGGKYYNNTDVLNTKPKLYMYNDHILIGRPEVFQSFLDCWNLFTDEKKLRDVIFTSGIRYILAPEAMFQLLCLGNGITPIMYNDDTWDIVR
jgi:hypothetical protein